jgi:hypothetical protein
VEGARGLAARALDRAGARGDDVVVREGASVLVRRGDVLARVRPEVDAAIAERELTLARRLLADGVPVVEPVEPVDPDEPIGDPSPQRADGFVVSCWRWIPAVRPATPDDLGTLVARLRLDTAPRGADGLWSFDPIAHIEAVVGECGDAPDVCFVRDRADALRSSFADAAAADPLGAAVVHGDLHAENVVVGADGPRLLDLELGGWGPASYDLVPAHVAVRRYGAPAEDLQRFLAAAGSGTPRWDGFETLVDVYELWVTAWAVSVADRRAEWAGEAARRVATLRDGIGSLWRLS